MNEWSARSGKEWSSPSEVTAVRRVCSSWRRRHRAHGQALKGSKTRLKRLRRREETACKFYLHKEASDGCTRLVACCFLPPRRPRPLRRAICYIPQHIQISADAFTLLFIGMFQGPWPWAILANFTIQSLSFEVDTRISLVNSPQSWLVS